MNGIWTPPKPTDPIRGLLLFSRRHVGAPYAPASLVKEPAGVSGVPRTFRPCRPCRGSRSTRTKSPRHPATTRHPRHLPTFTRAEPSFHAAAAPTSRSTTLMHPLHRPRRAVAFGSDSLGPCPVGGLAKRGVALIPQLLRHACEHPLAGRTTQSHPRSGPRVSPEHGLTDLEPRDNLRAPAPGSSGKAGLTVGRGFDLLRSRLNTGGAESAEVVQRETFTFLAALQRSARRASETCAQGAQPVGLRLAEQLRLFVMLRITPRRGTVRGGRGRGRCRRRGGGCGSRRRRRRATVGRAGRSRRGQSWRRRAGRAAAVAAA